MANQHIANQHMANQYMASQRLANRHQAKLGQASQLHTDKLAIGFCLQITRAATVWLRRFPCLPWRPHDSRVKA